MDDSGRDKKFSLKKVDQDVFNLLCGKVKERKHEDQDEGRVDDVRDMDMNENKDTESDDVIITGILKEKKKRLFNPLNSQERKQLGKQFVLTAYKPFLPYHPTLMHREDFIEPGEMEIVIFGLSAIV